MENRINASRRPQISKVLHLAIPVRWSPADHAGRGSSEVACTYDIHPRGARLLSAKPVTLGDTLLIERGRNKAICQVVWAADPDSPLRGQFTVQCVEEGRTPWDDELRQMSEQFQPVILEVPRGFSPRTAERPEANRRRRPRFYIQGQAQVIDGVQQVEGEIQQISEYGARIAASEVLRPGADFRLMLNVFDVSLALKAQVKYLADNLGMGVEFHQIRRGDRPLLSYVLSRLKTCRVEEFPQVEVVAEPQIAVAG